MLLVSNGFSLALPEHFLRNHRPLISEEEGLSTVTVAGNSDGPECHKKKIGNHRVVKLKGKERKQDCIKHNTSQIPNIQILEDI